MIISIIMPVMIFDTVFKVDFKRTSGGKKNMHIEELRGDR